MLDYIYFFLLSYELYSYYTSVIFYYNSFYYTYKVGKFIYGIPKKLRKKPKDDDEWVLINNDKDKTETIELIEMNTTNQTN